MDAATISSTIADRMASLRAERKLSLQAVADRAGLSKSHVWDLEQGRSSNPTIETAARIAAAFGVSLDYLTGLTTAQPCLHPEALRIACEVDALLHQHRMQPTSEVGKLIAFQREAANYFDKRDTGGEDMAFWANVANAENCRRTAEALAALAPNSALDVERAG